MLLKSGNKTCFYYLFYSFYLFKKLLKILIGQKPEIECLVSAFLLKGWTQAIKNVLLYTVLNCLALREKYYT